DIPRRLRELTGDFSLANNPFEVKPVLFEEFWGIHRLGSRYDPGKRERLGCQTFLPDSEAVSGSKARPTLRPCQARKPDLLSGSPGPAEVFAGAGVDADDRPLVQVLGDLDDKPGG